MIGYLRNENNDFFFNLSLKRIFYCHSFDPLFLHQRQRKEHYQLLNLLNIGRDSLHLFPFTPWPRFRRGFRQGRKKQKFPAQPKRPPLAVAELLDDRSPPQVLKLKLIIEAWAARQVGPDREECLPAGSIGATGEATPHWYELFLLMIFFIEVLLGENFISARREHAGEGVCGEVRFLPQLLHGSGPDLRYHHLDGRAFRRIGKAEPLEIPKTWSSENCEVNQLLLPLHRRSRSLGSHPLRGSRVRAACWSSSSGRKLLWGQRRWGSCIPWSELMDSHHHHHERRLPWSQRGGPQGGYGELSKLKDTQNIKKLQTEHVYIY